MSLRFKGLFVRLLTRKGNIIDATVRLSTSWNQLSIPDGLQRMVQCLILQCSCKQVRVDRLWSMMATMSMPTLERYLHRIFLQGTYSTKTLSTKTLWKSLGRLMNYSDLALPVIARYLGSSRRCALLTGLKATEVYLITLNKQRNS